jgi:hypothetical protein
VEPYVEAIVFGIQQAFSLAVAEVFLVGVGATVAALVVTVLFMKQVPLRKTLGSRPMAEVGAAAAVGADEIELPALAEGAAD